VATIKERVVKKIWNGKKLREEFLAITPTSP
jgi:hypothetical protein